jgi:hypothetical protein
MTVLGVARSFEGVADQVFDILDVTRQEPKTSVTGKMLIQPPGSKGPYNPISFSVSVSVLSGKKRGDDD